MFLRNIKYDIENRIIRSCELYINGKLQDSISGLLIGDMCKL